MIKVILVDDEPIFRTGLRSIVCWADHDCEIVGEASNGAEALQLIRAKAPDLVFLDIKMPAVDGIQVLKECRALPKPPCFIVLSCFNEYNYVREAMKLGAIDYLFKPLMEGPDIEKVLQEACDRLGAPLAGAEEKQREGRRQEALARLLQGGEEAAAGLLALEPALAQSAWFTAAFSLQAPVEPERCLALLGSCQAAVSGFFDSCTALFLRRENTLYALVYGPGPAAPLPPQRLRLLYRKLEDLLETPLWAGFDQPRRGPRELPGSLGRAALAMEANFFQKPGEPAVLAYEEPMGRRYDFAALYPEPMDALREAVLRYDGEAAAREMGRILDLIRRDRRFHREDFCHFLAAAITDFMRVYRTRIVLEELLLANYHLISDLYHQQDAEAAVQLFLQILQTLFAHLRGNTTGYHARLLQQVLEEVNSRYQEKLTLEAAAEKTHLSVNYFCKLFKEQTGETFVNYLNKVRVNAAVNLLRTTAMKTY